MSESRHKPGPDPHILQGLPEVVSEDNLNPAAEGGSGL